MKICPKNLILVKIVQSFDIADFHENLPEKNPIFVKIVQRFNIADFHENLPEKIKFLLKSYKDM